MIDDIDVEILTKEEKYWIELEAKMKESIQNAKRGIEIDKAVLKFTQEKIKDKKQKFK